MAGPVPTEAEVRADFEERKGLVDADARNEREAKRQRRLEVKNQREAVHRGDANEDGGDQAMQNPRDAWQGLEIEEYGPYFMHNCT